MCRYVRCSSSRVCASPEVEEEEKEEEEDDEEEEETTVGRAWRSGLKIKGTNPYVISVIFVSLCNPFYEADPLEGPRVVGRVKKGRNRPTVKTRGTEIFFGAC